MKLYEFLLERDVEKGAGTWLCDHSDLHATMKEIFEDQDLPPHIIIEIATAEGAVGDAMMGEFVINCCNVCGCSPSRYSGLPLSKKVKRASRDAIFASFSKGETLDQKFDLMRKEIEDQASFFDGATLQF